MDVQRSGLRRPCVCVCVLVFAMRGGRTGYFHAILSTGSIWIVLWTWTQHTKLETDINSRKVGAQGAVQSAE